MAVDLTGKIIVLTGAFGRLGRVLTRRLLSDGATVAGLDARSADPIEPSDRLYLFKADLGDETAVEQAFDRIAEEVGSPDALVHTVGMWNGQPFTETALEDWETMMRVNLTSAFLCFREAVRRMEANRSGGRLVGIASKQGLEGGVAEQAAYSASKAGVVRLVEAVAAEYGEQGITAAAVAPSTLLFGGESGDGVPAERVAELCAMLSSDEGAAHNGEVIRAYG